MDDVLRFWFGELDEHGLAPPAFSQRWWRKDAAFDEQIRERFGALRQSVLAGAHGDWLDSPRGRLATLILLDQFSRNLFRGSPEAFAADGKALAIALEGIELGQDRELSPDPRSFFYLPLMHSEDLDNQDRCVALFETFHAELTGPAKERAAGGLRFARQHRDIVARWGRFPHRNEVLGRPSSPEERAFLTQPGSSF